MRVINFSIAFPQARGFFCALNRWSSFNDALASGMSILNETIADSSGRSSDIKTQVFVTRRKTSDSSNVAWGDIYYLALGY